MQTIPTHRTLRTTALILQFISNLFSQRDQQKLYEKLLSLEHEERDDLINRINACMNGHVGTHVKVIRELFARDTGNVKQTLLENKETIQELRSTNEVLKSTNEQQKLAMETLKKGYNTFANLAEV